MNSPYNPIIGNQILRRRLSQDEKQWPISLGCHQCPDIALCGGISSESKRYHCYDNCCGGQSDCQIVCRNNPKFVDQHNEIRGFELGTIQKTLPLAPVLPHGPVPLFYHGTHRAETLELEAVFLRLRELINFRSQCVKFRSKEQLCKYFGIAACTKIYVTGIDQDKYIEKWWALTSKIRPYLISQLKAVGVSLITTPNYSMMMDVPRLDNLHSMKRIADNFSEFQHLGLASALHPNSRTDRDFDRWAELIAERREIKTLAYEFKTGAGHKDRIEMHILGLSEIAARCDRDLDIIIRGNTNSIGPLLKAFRIVTYIETSAFMKTVKRQKAIRYGNDRLKWIPHKADGTTIPLKNLFAHNLDETSSQIRFTYAQNET